MMLQPGDDDLIILLNIAVAPALCDQVDCLGRPADKDDLPCGPGIPESGASSRVRTRRRRWRVRPTHVRRDARLSFHVRRSR